MRYPTRGGLIIPPYELGYTVPTPADLQARRRTNIHHGYWPWNRYQGRIEQVFASLITNTYPMLSVEHNQGVDNLHADYGPPPQPSLSQMVEVLDEYISTNGVIECIRHKKTKEHYQLQPEEWNHIRNAQGKMPVFVGQII
jgi:hypothetical protein